jgi:SAM-dependent methyltransferase
MERFADPTVVPLIELADLQPADLVLDYGCGVGRVAFTVAPHVAAVEAFEQDREVLVEAERLRQDLGLDNVTFGAADLPDVPAEDGRYDLVVARMVLHRVVEPDRALAEMRRVTRPGGRIVVYEAVVDAAVDRYFNELARLREPCHWRHYTMREYNGLFQGAGLHEAERRVIKHNVELDSWAEGGLPSVRDVSLIRSRLRSYPVAVQIGLDAMYSDTSVSFSYDVLVVRLDT